MAIQQEKFLRGKGFEVIDIEGHPSLNSKEEFEKAVKLIWQEKIDGWWLYEGHLTNSGVCTIKQFEAAFYDSMSKDS